MVMVVGSLTPMDQFWVGSRYRGNRSPDLRDRCALQVGQRLEAEECQPSRRICQR